MMSQIFEPKGQVMGPSLFPSHFSLMLSFFNMADHIVLAAGRPPVPVGRQRGLEPIQNLVGPEAFQSLERLVENLKIFRSDTAHLLDGVDMPLI